MNRTADRLFALASDSPRATNVGFLIGGAVLTSAFAPFGLWFIAPLCALPLLLSTLRCSPRQSARHGFFFGVGLFGSGTYWIYVSVHVFGQAPLVIALFLMAGLVLIMASYCALLGWLMARMSQGNPWRLALVGPAAWTLIEWLRGWLFSGFPWLSFGYSQIDSPLAGWAPVLGVYGVSWMLLVSAGGLVVLLSTEQRRIAAVALVVMPWLVGGLLSQASWTAPNGSEQRTTIVQGGISQDRKWLREQFAPTLALYRRALLDAQGSSLVVWPEVAIPALMSTVEDYLGVLQRDVLDSDQTLALGILEPHANGRQVYNSVLVLDGERMQTYRKRHLVPFGEYFPVPDFVREWMRLMSLPSSDMQPGEEEQPLLVAADGTRMAAAICYEDAYGAEQLSALPDAEVLINVSNDAWFGDSIAPFQHLQVARMRALEAGRWVVRATNTGVSAFIDHRGGLRSTANQFEFATLTADVQPRAGATPYVRMGNTPLVALLTLILAVHWWPRQRIPAD